MSSVIDRRKRLLFSVLVLVLAVQFQSALPAAEEASPASPLAPEQALKEFVLAPGLRMELVACEPEVIDPVAIRFDEDGRMWVVEMRDYPHGPAAGEEPLSRIRILEDSDHDGRFETSHLFADKLLFATGLQPWKGGAIVTLAGRVAFMEDKDGDFRADVDTTLFTGFAEENSQLRANHPRLGLDRYIYVANGLRGGKVVAAVDLDGKPLDISGMDFRFDADYLGQRHHEAISGVGQFGLTFDDYGNRFVCSNRNPLKHIVLEDHYIKSNPAVAVRAAFHDVAAADTASHIYPISRAWTTSTLHAGQFTAACGVHIYRGDAMPDDFYGNAFTCDPTGNLVHREIMEASGATFTSRPAREGVEFLASRDEWFRPVNIETGPDGALYVVDMYRAVIEHPQFMPEELKKRSDLLHGNDRGRIWRVCAEDADLRRKQPPLSKATPLELVALLEQPNAWQRETALRLLPIRRDDAVVRELELLVQRHPAPVTRIDALWALAGMNSLNNHQTLTTALQDKHARVREQAVILSEQWFGGAAPLNMAADPDPKVRFRVALAAANEEGSAAKIEALKQIALVSANDPWTRTAVALAAKEQAADVATAILRAHYWSERTPTSGELALVAEFAPLVASADDNARRAWLKELTDLPDNSPSQRVQRTALLAFAQGLARARSTLPALLNELGDDPLAILLSERLQKSIDAIDDENADSRVRAECIELAAYLPQAADALAQLALSDSSNDLRTAAIASLSRHAAPQAWETLLAGFASEPPSVRSAILDGALARKDRIEMLLDKIEAGQVKAAEIDQTRTTRLLKHGDAAIRDRAQKAFADAIPADRQQVLADYQPVLAMKADPKRGLAVFKKNCATCHKIGDVGVNVAPDIADSRTKQPAQILTDVLQPNRAIDANYVSYSVITTDGRALSGILASETGSSVTLRQPEDKTVTLLRSEIEEIRSNGVSLMPEGLEKDIPHQEMADLIAFIKNWRYLDGAVPIDVGQ